MNIKEDASTELSNTYSNSDHSSILLAKIQCTISDLVKGMDDEGDTSQSY